MSKEDLRLLEGIRESFEKYINHVYKNFNFGSEEKYEEFKEKVDDVTELLEDTALDCTRDLEKKALELVAPTHTQEQELDERESFIFNFQL